MTRLVSLFFLSGMSMILGAEPVYQGRIDLGRTLESFATSAPVPGTLYLLSGAAGSVEIVSEDPFVAEVTLVQGEWRDETALVAHRAVVRFEGEAWSHLVVAKKPRSGYEALIYPYRRFQVAAFPEGSHFRALAVPLLY